MATLDELRERKAQREAAAAKAREAREVEILTLEESCETEFGGPRGQAFDIIDVVGEPLVVVKPGPAVSFKAFRESKTTLDDIQRFVAPCVVRPSREEFAALVERRAGALVRVFEAVAALYRGEAQAEGKGF